MSLKVPEHMPHFIWWIACFIDYKFVYQHQNACNSIPLRLNYCGMVRRQISTSSLPVRCSSALVLIPSEPSSEVRDLGVYFDSELNMKSYIRSVAKVCFYHLRRLRTLRSLLGREATIRLVSAFILSRLDYCNAVLVGLPASTLAPLQRVCMPLLDLPVTSNQVIT